MMHVKEEEWKAKQQTNQLRAFEEERKELCANSFIYCRPVQLMNMEMPKHHGKSRPNQSHNHVKNEEDRQDRINHGGAAERVYAVQRTQCVAGNSVQLVQLVDELRTGDRVQTQFCSTNMPV